jgi:hypothetical protein
MYRISQFKRRILFLDCLTLKVRQHYYPLKCWELPIKQYSITSQKIRSSAVTVRNSDSGISDVWQTELNVAEPLLSELCVFGVEIDYPFGTGLKNPA